MKKIKLKDNVFMDRFELSHAKELFELIDTNRDYLKTFMHWPRFTLSPEDTLSFIKSSHKSEEEGSWVFGIFVDDKIAGVCSFNSTNKTNLKTEIGYWIAENYQGQGLVTLACKELIRIGMEEFKLNRIGILCSTLNIPSQNIPKRLGFSLEGTLRNNEVVGDQIYDHHVYGLTKEDYINFKEKK